MLQAHEEDGRPFGKMMHDAVVESVQTLLMICGFIVFFAVLIEVLRVSGMMQMIGWPITIAYHVFGINHGLVPPTLAGLLEIDIGSAQTAAVTAPLLQKLALVSGIIGWSGLSVHAQVASVLTQTDIRMRPYFIARFLHALIAAALTVLFYGLGLGRAARAVAPSLPAFAVGTNAAGQTSWWLMMERGIWVWLICLAGLTTLSLCAWIVRRVHLVAWRV